MCQDKYNTKKGKYEHTYHVERRQIERWYNKENKRKKEIATLLEL